MLVHADGPPRAGKKKAGKEKGRAVGPSKAPIDPVATPPAKDKGKGKAVPASAGPAKAGSAVTTPSKSTKKRTAGDAPGGKDKGGQKKKRTKDTPNPPNAVYATPRSGPAFDSVMYATPLDWPNIYRAEDELWFHDVYERLQEVRERVRHDYAAMQDLGLKKGWLKEGDITEAEGDGSEDGSSDSGDVLNR